MKKNGENNQEKQLSQVLREWQDSRKGLVKESTYANYRNLTDRHLIPDIGSTALSLISTEMT